MARETRHYHKEDYQPIGNFKPLKAIKKRTSPVDYGAKEIQAFQESFTIKSELRPKTNFKNKRQTVSFILFDPETNELWEEKQKEDCKCVQRTPVSKQQYQSWLHAGDLVDVSIDGKAKGRL